jgi:prepilin-type N-terminal cleavage/methylation domain-containing protein
MYKYFKKGFTLVELLVVISIIALLVAILLPALSKARSQAKRLLCMTNVRSLTQALHLYANDWEGRFPPMALASNASDPIYGYWTYSQDTNLYQGGNYQRVHLGLLFPDYLAWDVGRDVLYCPFATSKPEDGWGYHIPEDPYPWDPYASPPSGSSGYSYHDRLGWGPGINWSNPPTGRPKTIGVGWTDPKEAIVADVPYFKFHDRKKGEFASGKTTATSGWSAGYIDGSVKFVFADEVVNFNGSSSYQDIVWNDLVR